MEKAEAAEKAICEAEWKAERRYNNALFEEVVEAFYLKDFVPSRLESYRDEIVAKPEEEVRQILRGLARYRELTADEDPEFGGRVSWHVVKFEYETFFPDSPVVLEEKRRKRKNAPLLKRLNWMWVIIATAFFCWLALQYAR